MQNHSNDLSKEDSELLIQVMDASLSISNSNSFFSWAQGLLQCLIPHDVLICGFKLRNQKTILFESFVSTRYVTKQDLQSITSYPNGLISKLITDWESHPVPILISEQLSISNGSFFSDESLATLKKSEFRNLAGHGVANLEGEMMTFFCFCRSLTAVGSRHSRILELLVPQMHNAFIRAFKQRANGLEQQSIDDDQNKLISLRQREVLRWVLLGKTNPEISSILSISVNTVKNHVHNSILKLAVENRLQAATKAYKQGLLE